jgi:hypothetical protein
LISPYVALRFAGVGDDSWVSDVTHFWEGVDKNGKDVEGEACDMSCAVLFGGEPKYRHVPAKAVLG